MFLRLKAKENKTVFGQAIVFWNCQKKQFEYNLQSYSLIK